MTDSAAHSLAIAVAVLHHRHMMEVASSNLTSCGISAPLSVSLVEKVRSTIMTSKNEMMTTCEKPRRDSIQHNSTSNIDGTVYTTKHNSIINFDGVLLPNQQKVVNANDYDDEDNDDSDKRLSRCRERNREHARKTRLRKKAHVQSLQNKVKELSIEHNMLKQRIDECSIASVLLALGSNDISSKTGPVDIDRLSSCMDKDKSARVALLAEGSKKCRRMLVNSVFQECKDRSKSFDAREQNGMADGIYGKTNISWKTGIFNDPSGQQRQLSEEELDFLRRERNRMHAKMTRDRKKCFVSTIQKTISDMEEDIIRMRSVLDSISNQEEGSSDASSPVPSGTGDSGNATVVAPFTIPELFQSKRPLSLDETNIKCLHHLHPPMKKVCNGFSSSG